MSSDSDQAMAGCSDTEPEEEEEEVSQMSAASQRSTIGPLPTFPAAKGRRIIRRPGTVNGKRALGPTRSMCVSFYSQSVDPES